MNSNTTPVVIQDKNGRLTTVHRRQEQSPQSTGKKNTATLPPINNAESRGKKFLASGADEKEAIIAVLKESFKRPLQEALSKHRKKHYLESVRAMERLISRSPYQSKFSEDTIKRYEAITADRFLEWTALAERHYDAIVSSPIADEKTMLYLAGLFSAGIHRNAMHLNDTGSPLTGKQEYNFLILNLAARESELEGVKIRQGSEFGLITCLDSKELTDFALTCDDVDQLHRICAVIKEKPVTRLSEAIVLADGDTIGSLANGAL